MRVVERTLGQLSAHDRQIIRYIDVSAPSDPAVGFRN
jgi:hypothetical protein